MSQRELTTKPEIVSRSMTPNIMFCAPEFQLSMTAISVSWPKSSSFIPRSVFPLESCSQFPVLILSNFSPVCSIALFTLSVLWITEYWKPTIDEHIGFIDLFQHMSWTDSIETLGEGNKNALGLLE